MMDCRKMGGLKKNMKNVNKIHMGPQKKRLCYRPENVALALEEVRQGKTIAEISRKYCIPESTIRAKKLGLYAEKKPGPPTVLSIEEEQEIIDWIFDCHRRNFPVTKCQLFESVKVICENLSRTNPFTDNKPGRHWYAGFLRRHPQITHIMAKKNALNRTKVSDSSLRNWFKEVSLYLAAEGLLEIEPHRIFNSDETAIPLNQGPSAALASEGLTNEEENITVLITGNAAGNLAPTFIHFNGEIPPGFCARMAPPEFAFAFSDSGWAVSKNYYEYIVNIFEPWLTKQHIKRPVIVYLNGHGTHMTLHLSKFCTNHGIVLVALYPNASLIQPLNTSLFQALKTEWQKIYKGFCLNYSCIGIKKYQFAPMLKQTFDSLDIQRIVQNGFRKCGFFPFNDNSRGSNKMYNSPDSYESQQSLVDIAAQYTGNMIQQTNLDKLKVLESLLSPEQLQSFRMNKNSVWSGIREDKSLFDIWYKLSYPCTLDIHDILQVNFNIF